MRKYYQAALVIVAFISFVALVFYRHEYNKLRYVLEVFNYFGKPSNNVENHMSDRVLPKALDNSYNYPTGRGAMSLEYYDNNEGFDEPIPSWQRLNDEIYVYSAYHIDGEEKIIAVGLVNHIKRQNMMLSCGIFYENDVESTPGIFTYRIIASEQSVRRNESNDRETHYLGYHLICKYAIKNNDRVIAGVKFVAKSQNKLKYSSIVVSVKGFTNAANERKSDKEYSGICIVPKRYAHPITSTDMINFVAFQISLGIDHLIVYDFGIAPRFNNAFKQIINTHDITIVGPTNITYTMIPWNFPTQQISHDIVRSIIQADCLLRTYKKVRIVATLTWDEYLILKYHRKILKLFHDIDETESLVADRYRISARNFCVDRIEKHETNDTVPRIFGTDKVFDDKRSVYIYRLRMTNEKSVLINDDIKTRDISADVIITNRYEDRCDHSKELEVIPLDDRYVGKFSKSILKSALSQLFFQHVY